MPPYDVRVAGWRTGPSHGLPALRGGDGGGRLRRVERRPVAIEVAGGEGVLIGPDNGVLASAVAMTGGAESPSCSTGRVPPGRAGPRARRPRCVRRGRGPPVQRRRSGRPGRPGRCRLAVAGWCRCRARHRVGGLQTDVLWVDRYGNCQLNVGPDDLAPWGEVQPRSATWQVTFGDATNPAVRVAALALVPTRSASGWPCTSAWCSITPACSRWCSSTGRRRSSWASPSATSASPWPRCAEGAAGTGGQRARCRSPCASARRRHLWHPPVG